jgi:hypothetical protein
MQVDKKIMEMCRIAVRQRFGDLEDLPKEIANTVANVFYRFFELSMKWAARKSQEPFSADEPQEGRASEKNTIKDITSYYEKVRQDRQLIDELTRYQRSFDQITRMVHELRDINRQENLDAYKDKCYQILDSMKYKIEDIENKNPIMRAIERALKIKEVDETPGLYKLL